MRDAVRSSSGLVRDDEPTGEAFGPAGTQTLMQVPASTSPLLELPDRAYDNLLVIAASDHPNRIEQRLERGGRDLANVGVVPVVPAVREYDGDLWTTDSVRPDDLTGLGMRFSDAIRHVESGSGWVLLDALGVLLMYSEGSQVCRFFQTLTNRVRTHDVRGVYSVTPDAIPNETYERLRSMCDTEHEVA